ncbi:MAG: hypothetical protein V3V92_03205 [Candidatus Hydrothermarchaeales archaeon]
MKVEILQDTENPLLDRRELVLKITHDATTPTFAEARNKIASALKAKKDVVVVQSIKSKFGIKEAIATANVYSDNSRALLVEMEHKLKKNFPDKAAPSEKESKPKEKAAVEKASEAKEEKPVKAEGKDEKTEEKKAEETSPKKEEKSEAKKEE